MRIFKLLILLATAACAAKGPPPGQAINRAVAQLKPLQLLAALGELPDPTRPPPPLPTRKITAAVASGRPLLLLPVLGFPLPAGDGFIHLAPGKKVYLAGDSLMEGLGYFLVPYFQRYDVAVIAGGRQNTGLVNEQLYNWPEQVRRTFRDHRDIGLMLLLVGANDPKDMGAAKFPSQAWEREYARRLQKIITIARSNGCQLVLLTVPPMGKKEFNGQMNYINGLLARVAFKNKLPLIHSARDLAGDRQSQVGKYLPVIDGRQIRAPDGVHFTRAGYDFWGNKVKDYFFVDIF